MRILHVITGLAAGGAEQQLRLMLRHLPERQQCDVVTLENPGSVAQGLREDGVRVYDLGMRGNRDLAALPRLTGLIRHGRYDVVHCHLYRACVYGRIAARLAGVRSVVATEHSLLDHSMEGRRITPGVRGLYLATEKLGRSTVAVSESVAGRLHGWGIPAHRVRLIPNGVDAARYARPAAERTAVRKRLRAELGLPQGAMVIGGLGRLVPGKRFDVLVDALALLPAAPAEGRPARLLLVGEGSERAALEQRARTAGIADRVVFTGERDDVPDLLTAMDVLGAPSTVETFGLALLEALAAGLPVRWSSGPALTELPPEAAPGACWTRSEPADYAEEFRALSRSAAGPLPTPPVVRHYDIVRLAGELATLYDELVGCAAWRPPAQRSASTDRPVPASAAATVVPPVVPPVTAKDSRHVRQ
jgi:glycosyltransferase involved in cell wall biosynthesis